MRDYCLHPHNKSNKNQGWEPGLGLERLLVSVHDIHHQSNVAGEGDKVTSGSLPGANSRLDGGLGQKGAHKECLRIQTQGSRGRNLGVEPKDTGRGG